MGFTLQAREHRSLDAVGTRRLAEGAEASPHLVRVCPSGEDARQREVGGARQQRPWSQNGWHSSHSAMLIARD